MSPDNSNIKNQINVTNIIYLALSAGLILFFLITLFFIQGTNKEVNNDIDTIFTFLVPVLGLIMMFSSRMIYNQIISKYDSGKNLLQKILQYRTAKIISWAMIESVSLLALMATMLTSNYLYAAVFIFLFGYFILLRPSKESLIRDMRLNTDESDLILKG
ncbi:MAG: hypothetical protein HXY48_06100 [Ignavibacteriaceae bacterium]|nr:hypothetical protein [Ignavibacteriaceae bacterium]